MTHVRSDQGCGLQVVHPPELPVARLVIGKSVDHAVEVLPLIFNLCKTAQSLAIRMACGRSVTDADVTELHEDIKREHRLKLQVLWPARLDVAGGDLSSITGQMTLDQACALSPLLDGLRSMFSSGQAVVQPCLENSVAERQADAPLMREIEASLGRGPLWRAVARFLELSHPNIAAPKMDQGWAVVPAARGIYRVRAGVLNGQITGFERVTPTDDMLRPGGAIDQSLATLPRNMAHLAPLVLDILDPCVPLELKETTHA